MNDPRDFNPPYGIAELLDPGIRRIVAPNPSPMTFRGTNTYLLGTTDIAVIDPGPEDPEHLAAILAALAPDQRITEIFVTHAHRDHAPLSRRLASVTGAPVIAFGDPLAGRSAVMQRLVAAGLGSGGEGVDTHFAPDIVVADAQVVNAGDVFLDVLWTPGHFGNHICLAKGDAVFTGDLVMGWSTSVISPPDGDLTDFMASARKLAARNDRIFFPGHGAPILEPGKRIRWLIEHRRERENQILAALDQGNQTIKTLAKAVYSDLPPRLLPMAHRNIFAHLIDLHIKNRVSAKPDLSENAIFQRS